MIDIRGIDKATLLAALVNAAKPAGRGRLHDDGKPMTREEAVAWIVEVGRFGPELYFDYVKGRPIKVYLERDTLEERLYDRDQGEGAAARVVAALRGAR